MMLDRSYPVAPLLELADQLFQQRRLAGFRASHHADDGRGLEPTHNKIAVCFLDGEFTVKRLKVDNDGLWLQPENFF